MRKVHFYREALEYQIRLLDNHKLVSVIGFWDDTVAGNQMLHNKYKKVKKWDNHEHHIHIRIKPPTMVPGQITQGGAGEPTYGKAIKAPQDERGGNR